MTKTTNQMICFLSAANQIKYKSTVNYQASLFSVRAMGNEKLWEKKWHVKAKTYGQVGQGNYLLFISSFEFCLFKCFAKLEDKSCFRAYRF